MPESPKEKPARVKETPEEKRGRLLREREELEEAIRDVKFDSLLQRVAFVLNSFPNTRNSDKALAIKYWQVYQRGDFNPVLADLMFKLEHVPTLTRARAKIQNSLGLFKAGGKVAERRRQLQAQSAEEYSPEKEIANKIGVFADETGKTDINVGVGGVWFLDGGDFFNAWTELRAWCKAKNVKSEFKFSKIAKSDIPLAREFLTEFLKHRSAMGIKFVWIKRAGSKRPIEQLIYDLYRHFLLEGLSFEISRKRVDLPRALNVTKDKDEGSDVIGLKDLRNKLRGDLNSAYGDDIRLEDLSASSSAENLVMQAVDLIIGSLNRRLNAQGEIRNHKDEFADMVLGALGIQEGLVPPAGSDWIQITELL